MQTILSSGYMMSRADRLAVADILVTTLENWALSGLKDYISYNQVSSLKRKWMAKLIETKEAAEENVPTDDQTIITDIMLLPDFVGESRPPISYKAVNRTQARDEQILSSGINIENYEYAAASAELNTPETWAESLIESKISRCRELCVQYWQSVFDNDPSIESYPSNEDAFIEFVVARPEYKNRAEREAENPETA